MSRRRNRKHSSRRGLSAYLGRPLVQLSLVVIIALIVFLVALSGGGNQSLASEVSVDEAYQMYQQGAFVLDVRTPEEWNEYHIPNATLIPLDQLASRVDELPHDRQIVVVCRSGNRSQQGRDILLAAGLQATCMSGGLKEWYARGYPIESAPPQP